MPFTLTKTETTILTEAAGREGGLVLLPDDTKPVTRERMLGRFVREDLVAAHEEEQGLVHRLLPAGYAAVGLTPPAPAGTKRDLVLGLIGRPEGASLAELVAATGWLPHTARGALSRLRSGGLALTRTARPDGTPVYRIVAEEPKPARRKRRMAEESGAEPVGADAVAA